MKSYECHLCKKSLEPDEAYEYRGAVACAEHFDEVSANRQVERAAIIQEERGKTEAFLGLDMSSDTAVGRANRDLLKRQVEIASKESPRLKKYERG